MKKLISILLLCSFIMSLSSGCLNKEERKEAKQNENLAKPLIESYINEYYSGATVKNVECMLHTSYGDEIRYLATECVKADVLYNNETFNIIVNLDTDKIYDNYKTQRIVEELEKMILEIAVDKPRDISIDFFEYEIKETLEIYEEFEGFLDNDINSAYDLLSSGRHRIVALCEYVASDMDFKSTPTKSFFKKDYTSDIEIGFVNYNNEKSYDNSVLEIDWDDSLTFYGERNYSRIKEAKIAVSERKNREDSSLDSNDEPEYTEDYIHFKSYKFGDVTFTWNDQYYNIEFSKEPGVTVQVNDYLGHTYRPKDNDVIKVECNKITDKDVGRYNYVYAYLGYELRDENNDDIYYTVVVKNGDAFTKAYLTDDEFRFYVEELFSPDAEKEEFTIGRYERIETEQETQ